MSYSIIALTGYARSGKSTAADALVKSFGYTRVRFADPLKNMLRSIGLCEGEIEGSLKEKPCNLLQGRSPRYAMQTLGTEWGRDLIGHDFWTGLWEKAALDILDGGGKVVIEDCRFINETTAVRNLFGTIIRINRKGSGIPGGHASEAMIDQLPYHYNIDNNGTVEALTKRLEIIVS